MAVWVLVALGVVVVFVLAIVIATGGPSAESRADRRRRYTLEETGERVPLAEAHADSVNGLAAVPGSEADTMAFVGTRSRSRYPTDTHPAGMDSRIAETQHARPESRPLGRLVQTPDGEMILTTPPFTLRDGLLSLRGGRYINGLLRRLPPWVVVCPKVRLDSLLTPTRPDGRDADDWRAWRQRVRVRAVDFVLCDRRTWKPLLGLMIDPATAATRIGGGKDRLIDEVLAAAGLPLVRGSGELAQDWPLIQPYVENAILPARGGDEAADDAARVKPDAAVQMLREDQEKGWLLE